MSQPSFLPEFGAVLCHLRCSTNSLPLEKFQRLKLEGNCSNFASNPKFVPSLLFQGVFEGDKIMAFGSILPEILFEGARIGQKIEDKVMFRSQVEQNLPGSVKVLSLVVTVMLQRRLLLLLLVWFRGRVRRRQVLMGGRVRRRRLLLAALTSLQGRQQLHSTEGIQRTVPNTYVVWILHGPNNST